MSKPRSKRESWYYTWLWELRYICHTPKFKKWLKRQTNKARRRGGDVPWNRGGDP